MGNINAEVILDCKNPETAKKVKDQLCTWIDKKIIYPVTISPKNPAVYGQKWLGKLMLFSGIFSSINEIIEDSHCAGEVVFVWEEKNMVCISTIVPSFEPAFWTILIREKFHEDISKVYYKALSQDIRDNYFYTNIPHLVNNFVCECPDAKITCNSICREPILALKLSEFLKEKGILVSDEDLHSVLSELNYLEIPVTVKKMIFYDIIFY